MCTVSFGSLCCGCTLEGGVACGQEQEHVITETRQGRLAVSARMQAPLIKADARASRDDPPQALLQGWRQVPVDRQKVSIFVFRHGTPQWFDVGGPWRSLSGTGGKDARRHPQGC